jgi:hypothetical protein
VHALPAVLARAERVVIGEQHRVRARLASGAQQLGNGGRPIGLGRVHVHDA